MKYNPNNLHNFAINEPWGKNGEVISRGKANRLQGQADGLLFSRERILKTIKQPNK